MYPESLGSNRLLTRMADHGATMVELDTLLKESDIVWSIGPNDEVSETCIHLEEFSASAARNCRSALGVIDRIHGSDNVKDPDLLTALKKYVEDACEAIKEIDETLERNNASLASLLFELPNDTQGDEASWRNLIGRRVVIAHRLLTVDDERVYREAVRDFGLLSHLISRVYFVPTKTDYASGKGFTPLLRTSVLRSLNPAAHGQTPRIGESVIFIYEDRREGFLPLRMGRSEGDKVLVSGPHALPFSLQPVSEEELRHPGINRG